VDPVPDRYFSENLVALGIKPGTSGYVARNSDHYTTDAVLSNHNTQWKLKILLDGTGIGSVNRHAGNVLVPT
jgi:hypothetical protein